MCGHLTNKIYFRCQDHYLTSINRQNIVNFRFRSSHFEFMQIRPCSHSLIRVNFWYVISAHIVSLLTLESLLLQFVTGIFIIWLDYIWESPCGFRGQNRPTPSLEVVGGDQWLSRLLPWCCRHPPHGTTMYQAWRPCSSTKSPGPVDPADSTWFFGSPAQGFESFFSCSLSLRGAYCPLYAVSSCGGTLAQF